MRGSTAMRLVQRGPHGFPLASPTERPPRCEREDGIRSEEDDQFADDVVRDQGHRDPNERTDRGYGRNGSDDAVTGQRDPACPTGDRQQDERNQQSNSVPEHE
jgi:hypothetical protein